MQKAKGTFTNHFTGGIGVIDAEINRTRVLQKGQSFKGTILLTKPTGARLESGKLSASKDTAVIEDEADEEEPKSESPPAPGKVIPAPPPPPPAPPAPEPTDEENARKEVLRNLASSMDEGDFTTDGRPNLDALNAKAGTEVPHFTVEERDKLWKELSK
jgi:hypothetical protein